MKVPTKRHARVIRILIWVVPIIVIVIGASVYGLRRIEAAITFHPVRYEANSHPAPAGAEDVWFKTRDGLRLHGWLFRSEGTTSKPLVIYFHGNGGNITNIDWVARNLSNRRLDVLLFDYRGYGLSTGEATDEIGLYADADAAYEFAMQRGYAANRIVFYGQSLGTAAAIDLAARRDCAALIVESGLTSASDMATQALPWLPRRLHILGRNRFDSINKVSQVRCAILITHGQPDPIIPTEQGIRLFEAARSPKKLLLYPGAEHNVFGSQGEPYLDVIAGFVHDAVANK